MQLCFMALGDVFLYGYHLLFIIILVIITSIWGKHLPTHNFYARKVLHIGAIHAVAHATLITPNNNREVFSWIVLTASVLLTVAVYLGFFRTESRRSWGIAFFPWVLWAMLVLTPIEKYPLISTAFFVLAWADGLSAVMGKRFGGIKVWREKTLAGFLVFMITAMAVLYIQNPQRVLPMEFFALMGISLSAAMVEVLGDRGTDNIWIPIWVFLLLSNLQAYASLLFSEGWPFCFLGIGVLSWWVYRKKWLDISGLFAALLLFFSLVIADVDWWPMVLFFIGGSLASKLNNASKSDIKQGKPRDAFQVLANASPVWFVALLSLQLEFDHVNLWIAAVMSAALADTWSSEFGMRWGGTPFSPFDGKPLPIGVSGGVTWVGFLGAFLGGGAIAMYAYFFVESTILQVAGVLGFGILGSLLDTTLGWFLQEKGIQNGEYTDRLEGAQLQSKGLKGINNDVVNALTLWLVALFAWLSWVF